MEPRVAVVITNYNMPERADALAEYISTYCLHPHDLYLVDNGSDLMPPAEHTTVRLPVNLQTVGGWSAGFEAADRAEAAGGFQYFAYWVVITSAKFDDFDDAIHNYIYNNEDLLSPLVELLRLKEDAIGVHPALDCTSTTHWEHLKRRERWEGKGRFYSTSYRRTWMIDNIAALWRADWFKGIGRFDKRLEFGWGSDLETCYLARKQGKSLWIHDGVLIHKDTDVGYDLGRMGMSAEERRRRASEQMDRVLTLKYGPAWRKAMEEDYIEEGWR